MSENLNQSKNKPQLIDNSPIQKPQQSVEKQQGSLQLQPTDQNKIQQLAQQPMDEQKQSKNILINEPSANEESSKKGPLQENSNEDIHKIQSNVRFYGNFGSEKLPGCNCKKTKCIKLYCECYSRGISCGEFCKCIGCQNTKNHIRERRPQGRNDEDVERQSDSNKKSIKVKQKTCNCRKSFCLKKYCQCFNSGQACGQNCKCQDCKNNGDVNYRSDKRNGQFGTIGLHKVVSQVKSDKIKDKSEEYINIPKAAKLDEDEIQTRLAQILKLVPAESQQSMLDFLVYYLS